MAKKNLFIYSHIQATSCFHHFANTPTLSEQGKLPSHLRVAKSRRRLIQTNSFWWSKNKLKKLWDVHSLKGSLSDRPAQLSINMRASV